MGVLVAAPEVRIPARDAVERALVDLERRLGPSKVDTSETALLNYGQDESEAIGRKPDAVVLADGRDDIAAVLAIAEKHGVPVTPRAGGTGRTGGAVPVAGGIVLATHAMSKILEINRQDLLAVVQPGVVTADLHAAVEAEGMFYPPDPNSLKTCMIGGNVAENAGGPRAFKYGVTREYVLGLEACLMGGRVVRTGKRTIKGVTGYDVTALLVGSEGTLGVFSEITLKLVPRPQEVATVLALFEDVRDAADAVRRIIAGGLVPRCLELMDGMTLGAIRKQGVAVDPRAQAMLLIEVDGGAGTLDPIVERLGEALTEGGHALDVVAAQDAAQRARLWEARRMLSPATRKLAKYKLSEDVVVPRSRLVDLLTEVDRIGERTGVMHLTYGHAGDGNLHVNFLWNDDSERPAIDRAIGALMRATVDLGGTLSGEHGIGVLKAAYLPLEQSSELIALQQDLKRVFDPSGLLNPGKIFPTGHAAC
ncbi:Glycolate dehydrogenase [Labilithrix luteola]|uniref:Glycolate dehydrogenase n=1 Tax=Labilithrix luteola TaxID=1391654 RepID=A0A0K1PLD2_9BACT|nr:FAD-linked oxidase C-terminal domain-containing protein [Labilithrix luteola]AKU94327.1 Glycolate dehydrogenase [Labilithrix luteola]